MAQLNLFEHAPRDYHEALRRLEELDFGGCRASLEAHRQRFPAGADTQPVEEAAAWLETRLPGDETDVSTAGRQILLACRDLREGRTATRLLEPRGALAQTLVPNLARAALRRAREEPDKLSASPEASLPWPILNLFAGNAERARAGLIAWQREHEPTALAYLALGDACTEMGRTHDAAQAYREGYGLDPTGGAWAPVPTWIAELRAEFAEDPLFRDDWWAVGAYLDGRFSAYECAEPDLVTRRWRRFVRGGATGDDTEPSAPSRFFAGLFLSEHGAILPLRDLALVRQTLRDLHAEAFEMHMERLAEQGPPRPFTGREYIGW